MTTSDREQIVELMRKKEMLCFLSTSVFNQPYTRAISPVVEDDLTIWITTYSCSRKITQIKHNNKVCLYCLEAPYGNSEVNITGEVLIIDDMNEKKRIWELAPEEITSHFPDGYEADSFCLLKIEVKYAEYRVCWDNNAPEGGMKVYKP